MNLPGKPIAYVTTDNFLRCFGLGGLSMLLAAKGRRYGRNRGRFFGGVIGWAGMFSGCDTFPPFSFDDACHACYKAGQHKRLFFLSGIFFSK